MFRRRNWISLYGIDEGHTETDNVVRNRLMTTDYYYCHEIKGIDVEYMSFQQDGTTCHFQRATLYVYEKSQEIALFVIMLMSTGRQDHDI